MAVELPAQANKVRVKRYAAGRARALGEPTRGTTAPNRLRRVDRWLVGTWREALLSATEPLVVDLGFGAHPVTTVELFHRLRAVRPDAEVVGIEIDPARVAVALPFAEPGLSFRRGGFEIPLDGRSPTVVRAFNVLRQYEEAPAAEAWATMLDRLAPGGLLVEGTCDEIGRRGAWVALDASGPLTLTLAAHLATLGAPSELAERLPKSLIHHNVPGQPIHSLLTDFDRAWASASSLAPFGPRHRWVAALSALASSWPVIGGPARWRLGEMTVAWAAVAPLL